jgi:purine-binding chemotaxis protein CheW
MSGSKTADSAGATGRTAPLQIVTFRVDGRSFGIDVGAIREIKGWQQTTPLPNAASHVLGVINLRGAIIAVYDLRRRLGIGATELCRSSVVLVADVGDRQIGILADAVSDIVDVPESALRAAPPLSSSGEELVRSLVVRGEEVVALLELDTLITEYRQAA